MKKGFSLTSIILIVSLLCAVFSGLTIAATTNPTPNSPGYTPVVLPIMSTISSATGHLGTLRFTAPAGYNIVTANVSAQGVSGTNPTLKTRIKSGVYTNYSGTISAAGASSDLVKGSTARIADESSVVVDMIAGGTTPKWKNLTLFILLKRL